MKYTPLSLLAILVAVAQASPVPAIEWVTVTAYTTIVFGQGDHEAIETSSVATNTASAEQLNLLDLLFDATTSAESAISTEESSEVATVLASTAEAVAEATVSLLTSSTSSSAPTSTGTSSEFSGEGTYYAPGLGACGETNTDTDLIVAISYDLFDQYTPNGNPNKNTLCGKKIIASYEGKSVEVTVVDRCEGCAHYDLDFSPSAFSDIAEQSLGRIDITWKWA